MEIAGPAILYFVSIFGSSFIKVAIRILLTTSELSASVLPNKILLELAEE